MRHRITMAALAAFALAASGHSFLHSDAAAAPKSMQDVIYQGEPSHIDSAKRTLRVAVQATSASDSPVDLCIDSRDSSCGMSIRLGELASIVRDGGRLSVAGTQSVRVVDQGTNVNDIFLREDGNVEWLITLNDRPAGNLFVYSLDSRGLRFYYQDTLTDIERAIGAERPDSVIGSWAVYHKADAGRSAEGATGKAFHIYRPKAWDSFGDTTWGNLAIDTTNGRLIVTLDQSFLTRAVYPVIIDPTFGLTSAGASSTALSAVEAWANKNGDYFYQSDGSETVDSLYACLKSYSAGTYYADLAVYAVESGNPSNRVGSVATVSGTGSVATWRGVSTNIALTTGTTNTLATGNPVNGTRVQYDSGISGQNSRQTTSTQLGAVWDHVVDGTMLLSIYAVYSNGETVPAVLPIRRRRFLNYRLESGGRNE